MTQNDIREYLGTSASVFIQVAGSGDGSPEIAWGDTFFYARNSSGEPQKMPFTTIVAKEYPGFDCESKLDRGGLFRLNIEVGKEMFQQLFNFKENEFDRHSSHFNFDSINLLFPHPVYGASSWVSIINPDDGSAAKVNSLLEHSLERASRHAATRQ